MWQKLAKCKQNNVEESYMEEDEERTEDLKTVNMIHIYNSINTTKRHRSF